jgi:plasmid stabilization system protein ParE
MTCNIVWRPEAEIQMEEAFETLQAVQEQLAQSFVSIVDAKLQLLSVNSKIHQKVFGDVRRAVLKKFSYAIYYCVEGNDMVVISVFQGKRDPRIWQDRV